jgi:arylsulfatase A-like enzyme
MVSSLELFPTVATAAGAKTPKSLDGVDLLPHLASGDTAPIRAQHYWRVTPQAALRSGDWKIVRARGPQAGWQLFNLADDIGEDHDLASAQPAKLAELEKAWRALDAEMIEAAWQPGGGRRAGKQK